jgi:signal transduction histidine kinase
VSSKNFQKQYIYLFSILFVAGFFGLALVASLNQVAPNYSIRSTGSGMEFSAGSEFNGQKIVRLKVENGSAASEIDVKPEWLLGAADAVRTQAARSEFYAGERQLFELAKSDRKTVAVTASGNEVVLQFADRGWKGLGLEFWMPILAGLLSVSLGVAVLTHTQRDTGTLLFFIGTLAYFIAMCGRAWIADRPWGQSPEIWAFLLNVTHICTGVFIVCEVGALMRAPNKLFNIRWWWLLVAVESVFLILDVTRLVDSTKATHTWPIIVMGLMGVILIGIQAKMISKTPEARLVMKWVLLSVALSGVLAIALLIMTVVLSSTTNVITALNLVPVIIVFTHAALLVRTHLYRLETWWWRTWLWLTAGAMVIAIEGIVLGFTTISGQFSLTIALAIAGWLYFPLRQWMMLRFAPQTTQTIEDFIPALMELSTIQVREGDVQAHWRSILERAFEPQSILVDRDENIEPTEPAPLDLQSTKQTHIESGGAQLRVPGLTAQEIVLTGANRGQRGFRESDVQLVSSLLTIARQGLAAQARYSEGVIEERKRIAADLHDDIGGKLLHLANRSGNDGDYARNTLEDLRTITRGLNAQTRILNELIADLRYQLAERAERQNLSFRFDAELSKVGEWQIGSRQGTLLNSICSELLRNAMQHQPTTSIAFSFRVDGSRAYLRVENDGQFSDPASWKPGLGMISIRRRINDLDGKCHWTAGIDTNGILFFAEWPLATWLGPKDIE